MATGSGGSLRDKVKSMVSIELVVGTSEERIPCPFHNSKAPDLQILKGNNTWKCWGGKCRAKGDVIDWVMRTEGVDFSTALATLARRFNIAAEDPRERKDILEKATAHFHEQLFGPEGGKALDYLINRRKFAYETVMIHRLGLCTRFPKALTQEEARDVGLVHKERLQLGSRIVFPVRNRFRDVVSMQGRIYLPGQMRDPDVHKYIALPGRPSHTHLDGSYPITDYFFNECALHPHAIGDLWMVEGAPDAVTLDQWNLRAVGVFGCKGMHKHAHKFQKIRVLKVCMDADEATRSEMMTELALLQAKCPWLVIYDVLLDGIKDANELLVAGGTRADFLALAEVGCRPFVERLIDLWAPYPHLHQPLLKAVAAMPDPGDYVPALARLLGETEAAVRFGMRLVKHTPYTRS